MQTQKKIKKLFLALVQISKEHQSVWDFRY